MTKQFVRVKIVKNKIPDLIEFIPQEQKRIAWELSQELFNVAQSTVLNSIYDTGELYRSGGIRAHKSGYNVGYTADHAVAVHDGTSKMEARPWLFLAAEFMKPQLASMVSQFKNDIVGMV